MSDVQAVTPAVVNGGGMAVIQKSTAVEVHKIKNLDITEVQRVGNILAASGYFKDSTEMAQAAVKVMAGQELGIPPVASMMGINIIKGKVALGGNLIASRIRAHGYDYQFLQFDSLGCSLRFLGRKGDPDLGKGMVGTRPILGDSSFNDADAKQAEIKSDMYKKYPRNMFFNRSISNGAKWYTPEVFAGAPVYTPEELGAQVDEDGNYVGETIDVQTVQPTTTTPVATQQAKAEPKPEPSPEEKAIADGIKARIAKLSIRFGIPSEEFSTKLLRPFWMGYFNVEALRDLPKDFKVYEAPIKVIEALSETGEESFLQAPTDFGRQVVADALKKAAASAEAQPTAVTPEVVQPKAEAAPELPTAHQDGSGGWTKWDAETKTLAGKLVNVRNYAGGMNEVAQHIEKCGLKSAPIEDVKAYLTLCQFTGTARLAITTSKASGKTVAQIVDMVRVKVGGALPMASSHDIDVALADVATEAKGA